MKYWHTEIDEQKIIWLTIDVPSKSQNFLNLSALNELHQILEDIKLHVDLKALVITSRKENSFIAGADISYFQSLKTWDERLEFIRKGQIVFDTLAHLNIPTIALIKGHCLGGGLELALACKYRIALENEKVFIGLPEVRLGIIPVWGGINRLAKLIGPFKAMDLIVRGKLLHFSEAQQINLIDFYLPERSIKTAVKECSFYHQKRRKLIYHWSDYDFIRNILAKWFCYRLSLTGIHLEHYPAPYKAAELFSKKSNLDEIHLLRYLVEKHPTAKNLVRVFFLEEHLKKFHSKNTSTEIRHVHIIGAGKMGGSIAAFCALKGIKVTLQDKTPNLMTHAFHRAEQLFKKKLTDARLIQKAKDLLIPDNGYGIKKADLIIEAIVENSSEKNDLFVKEIEPLAKADAILATNTSSIDLNKISKGMKNPERLLGLHFFDPLIKMKLVEVVKTDLIDEHTFERAISFVHQIDRLPLVVKNNPGFLVNRMLKPYLLESLILYEEGVSPYLIDKAAERFGMPIGPVELADSIGLDVCLEVLKNLHQHSSGKTPFILTDLVKRGEVGKKVGKGFYHYRSGKPVKQIDLLHTVGEDAIIERLMVQMFNEACACLEEKIIADGDLLDSALIFGIGFAPFRGGLIQYAKELGETHLESMFERMHRQYGKRFMPHSNWKKWLV